MTHLFNTFLIVIFTCSLSFLFGQEKDSIYVVSSVKEFRSCISMKDTNVVLRTYKIKFDALNQCQLLLNKESTNFLDSLATVLNENPEIRIEIGVHLSIRYSQHYSSRYECMPQGIKNVLIKKNIESSKITIINYLDSFPLINNDNPINEVNDFWEEELKQNKRVEFRVLSYNNE